MRSKDHVLQITIINKIIMKKFEISRESPKCITETQSKPMPLKKMAPIRLLTARLPQKLQFGKNTVSAEHSEVKCNKTSLPVQQEYLVWTGPLQEFLDLANKKGAAQLQMNFR